MKKPQVNIHRKRNVVIAVIVDNDNRILLTRKYQPDSEFLHGKWQLPGLGMMRDEMFEETLKRIAKEFNIEFVVLSQNPIETLSYRNKNAYTILHIFAAEYICHPETTEWVQTDNVTWLPYEDINPEDCTPLTMEIIELARED